MNRCEKCYGTGVAPDWKRLGKELRRRRVIAGLSLRKVARWGGMSAAHLSDMERGRRSMGGEKGRKVLAKFGLDVLHAYTMPVGTWRSPQEVPDHERA